MYLVTTLSYYLREGSVSAVVAMIEVVSRVEVLFMCLL